MAFPEVSARRPRWLLIDLTVLVGACTLPLAAVSPPSAPETAFLAVILLALGGLLWLLADVGARFGRLGPIVLPAIIAVTAVDLVLSCIAFVCEPRATVLILAAQVGSLIYVSFRW
jgi:hypothetical protein